jgi:hypothetical protein
VRQPHASQDSPSVDGQRSSNEIWIPSMREGVSRHVMTLPRPQASCRNQGNQVARTPFVVLNVELVQKLAASRKYA